MRNMDAVRLIRGMGLHCKHYNENSEFEVDYKTSDPRFVGETATNRGTCYFTNDADDAVATARLMSGHPIEVKSWANENDLKDDPRFQPRAMSRLLGFGPISSF